MINRIDWIIELGELDFDIEENHIEGLIVLTNLLIEEYEVINAEDAEAEK